MVSRRVRRRRRQVTTGLIVLFLIVILLVVVSGSGSKSPSTGTATSTTGQGGTAGTGHDHRDTTLSPDWRGDDKPVTLAFGGDVHFEGVLGTRLAANPQTALDGSIATLMSGSELAIADLDTALTNGTCPTPQPKQYVWYAPASALTALKSGGITLATMANDHGEDCGPAGLQMSLSAADTAHYPIVGIGSDAAQAFAPYRVTVDGQRIAVITATQLLPPGLQGQWTATSSQPGVASAIGQSGQAELIAAVQAARQTSDTVVVYLYWGTETQACPNPQQKPLAEALVKAGADIVVGSGTHVQSGAGYLGRAFVDYGLGNLAFYDTKSPETSSGSLVVTVTGRHVDKTTWRPALISDGLPQPLTGASAASAVQQWDGLRGCTGLAAAAGKATATVHAETAAPTTTTIKSTTTTTHRG